MTIAFFVWFMIKVTQSFKEDLQFYKCDHIEKKLPLYRQAILGLKNQRLLLEEDERQLEEDLEEIGDLLGEEKKTVPPLPVAPKPEEIKGNGSFEKVDQVEILDDENKTPCKQSISSMDARELVIIEKSSSHKTPEKAKEIKIETP